MLISPYLIIKNNYVLPNFIDGMLCNMTISASSWYVSMIEFMEMNKDDHDDMMMTSAISIGHLHADDLVAT